jgi:RHS repeat-associated protein
MNVAVDLDLERSLGAMWDALCTASRLVQDKSKIGAAATPVETIDYYPFGSLKFDTATSSYDGEARKYIGQYSDTATGLDYLNARYYDPAQGQFLSEDPVFLSNPLQQDLGNPQNLNSYSYGIDNPITNADTSGKYVYEISRPVASYVPLSSFAHTFAEVVPQNGESLASINGSNMSIDTSQPFTLSGEPNSQFPSHLSLVADNPYDYSTATENMSVPWVARELVTPPPGMTSEQFDASVVSTYDNLSPDQGIYDPLG